MWTNPCEGTSCTPEVENNAWMDPQHCRRSSSCLGDQEAAPGSITRSIHPPQLGCGLIHAAPPPQTRSQFTFAVSHFGFRGLYGVSCQFLLLWLCLCLLCLAGFPLLPAEDQIHGPEAQESAHLEEKLQPQIPVGCKRRIRGAGILLRAPRTST